MLVILGSQLKENLTKQIKKSPFFGVLTKLIKFYYQEKWKAVAAFNDSIDQLNFPETNAGGAKMIQDWLIDLISRLDLDLKN